LSQEEEGSNAGREPQQRTRGGAGAPQRPSGQLAGKRKANELAS